MYWLSALANRLGRHLRDQVGAQYNRLQHRALTVRRLRCEPLEERALLSIAMSDGFDYPVGPSTYCTEARDGDGWYNAQDFGVFNEVFNGFHMGEDWNSEAGGNADYGSPVYAASKGTVVYAGAALGWGNVVIIRHQLADGALVETLYGHLERIFKTSGDVARREQIGTIGDGGGLYEYAHLHFEVRFPDCPNWGGIPSPGPGYGDTPAPQGWTDPSEFIDCHRSLIPEGTIHPSIGLTGAGSTLSIFGTSGWDIISLDAGSVIINYNGQQLLPLSGEPFDAKSGCITHIEVISGSGGGYFDFRDSPVPVIFFGGDGDDEIYGSPFNDIIYCGGGTDFVRAGDGADEIYAIAGSGNRLFGGAGDDVIHGSDGGDYITGGADSDTIIVGPSDYVVDATAEDYVSVMNDRTVQRRQDRINSRQQEQQNVASPQQGGVQVSAAATPEITDFTINQNVVTEGESVVFTVYAAEPNWARLVLFVDEDGNGQYNANVDTELGQFRGRNQNWRGQIGTVKLGPGTFDVYAMLLPFSGSAAVSAPITLTVEEEVVLPEPPSMPDAVQINPDDILILLPHRNGDVTVPGNTLVGNGIDLWELTPRTGGGFAFWTEGTSDTIVALYDAEGNRIGQWDSSNGPDENGELVVTLNDDTTYYIAVAAESGDGGDYDLYVTGHNQTTAGAISLDPSTHAGSVSASFSDNHRLDYFSLLSPEGATVLDVTVDSDPSLELWVRVADENNNLIGLGRPGDQILTGLPVEPNTVYYITAFGLYGTDGSYTVTADFYPDESGLPAELSPSPEAEWLVPMPDGSLQVEGLSIDVPAEFDYYLLTPRSLPLVIETTGSLDTRIGLYQRFSDSNSSLVAENDDGGDGRNARLVIDQAEEYIVLVRSGNDETGSYSLSISSPAVGIAGLMPTGLEATVSSSVGAILNNERYHIYRTEVPAFSNTLDLTMEYIPTAAHPEDWVLDAWVRISDADGNVVRILDAGGEQANEMVQDLSVSPGATYYITVAGKDFTIGQYQLHLDYNPDYPVTSGNEFPISSISNSNEWPDVDRNAAGQGVVVWNANIYEDGFGYNTIHALRIGPDGQPAGTEVELYRGSYDSPSFHPVVAVAPDGTSVVAWNNVFRRFSATGVPLSGETEFASATQSPTETDIAMGPAGEFVIVWTSFNNGDSDGGIFAQRYNASGSPAGSEIHVNQTTDGYQSSPQVAYLSNGQWVVTWHSVLHSTDSLDVAARAFSDGAPVTDDFTVNTTLPRYQGTPMIAASPDGYGYVILWMSQRADGVWYGDAQRFSDEHLPLGDEFQATTSPLAGSGVFTEPCIAFGSQGRFLVVSVTGDTSGKGIAAQQYDAQGHRVGPELILNQEEANDQDTPAIASDQDDRFLLAWRSGVSGALAIKGLEYPLSDINEPEITVLDSAGTPDDLTIDFGQLVSAGAPVAYDVTIRNDGNAELSVTHLVLSGNGAAAFSLDDDTAFTLQGGQSRTLTVTFDPANSGSYAAALTIEHNDSSDVASGDVDPVPLFVNLTAEVVDSPKLDVTILPGTISETAGNGAAAVLVTRRNVSDADLALPLSITLSSSDETEAVISGTAQIPAEQMSVVVYVDAVDDFEDDGTQSVVISASAVGLASGGAFLEVESANHPPLLEPVDDWAIELGQTVSFTAVASDPDNPPDGLTFSLIGDFPPEATIDGGSGAFSWTPIASDAGQTRLFAIRVVDDGDPQLSDTIAFTVTVNDSTVPAAPAVTSPALQVTVNADTYLIEGTAEADCLVTVYIDTNNNNQVDAGEPVAGQQQLAGGAIEFSVLVGLAQDAANDFVVTATDAVGNVSLAADVPTITEDSAPIAIRLFPNRVDENQPAGTLVGSFSTTDLTPGDSFTYALVAGDGDVDNASFEIVGHQLRTTAAFDCEAKSSYSIRVRTSDAAGLWYEQGFTIAVNDVNEVPPVDFNVLSVSSYDTDQPGGETIEDDGAALRISGNHWKKIEFPYEVTPNTIVEFDFQSSAEGEIHAIGFDTDNTLNDTDAARFFELYGTQTWGLQAFRDYASSSPAVEHYVIPAGRWFQGTMSYLVLATDDDADASGESLFSNIRVYEPILTTEVQGVSQSRLVTAFSTQDVVTQALSLADDFQQLQFSGNAWKKIALDYDVTANTVLEFDFQSSAQGEIQGIGFDNDEVLSDQTFFQLFGTQTWGKQAYRNYAAAAGTMKHYAIPVGKYFTGAMSYLVFGGDDDANAAAEVVFSNIRLYEPTLAVETQGVSDSYLVTSYGAEDLTQRLLSLDDIAPAADGFQTLQFAGNSWKKIDLGYTITANTVLEFDFQSTAQGEIQGIGFDSDQTLSTATFFQLYGTQTWGKQAYRNYAASAGEVVHYVIPVGQYFQGDLPYLVLSCDDDADATGEVTFSNLRIYEPKLTVEVQGVSESLGISSYADQDVLVQRLSMEDATPGTDGFQTLHFAGNAWKKVALDSAYTVTANTILEFDFQSSVQGEIQGIGFDNDEVLSDQTFFQLYGTQKWGLQAYRNYAASAGETVHYAIPVGEFFSGAMSYLIFAGDDDSHALAENWFSNIRLYEGESEAPLMVSAGLLADQASLANENTTLESRLASDQASPSGQSIAASIDPFLLDSLLSRDGRTSLKPMAARRTLGPWEVEPTEPESSARSAVGVLGDSGNRLQDEELWKWSGPNVRQQVQDRALAELFDSSSRPEQDDDPLPNSGAIGHERLAELLPKWGRKR